MSWTNDQLKVQIEFYFINHMYLLNARSECTIFKILFQTKINCNPKEYLNICVCSHAICMFVCKYTLAAEMFGVGDFWLETRVIIKILSHPWYRRTFDWFSWGWSKTFFFEKKVQNGQLKKTEFFKIANSQNFLWKFHGLVLGLEGLIDAKGIDLSQPIWLWGCPT